MTAKVTGEGKESRCKCAAKRRGNNEFHRVRRGKFMGKRLALTTPGLGKGWVVEAVVENGEIVVALCRIPSASGAYTRDDGLLERDERSGWWVT